MVNGKSKIQKQLIFFLMIASLLTAVVFAQVVGIDIKILGQSNPAISRFVGFAGVIPSSSARDIYRHSLKLFINNKDETLYLQNEKDGKTGDIYLSYTPVYPLPLGNVEIKITGTTLENKEFSYSQKFVINPEKDKLLAPYVAAVRRNSKSWKAHFDLAGVYEKKYLLRDAMYEYSQALKYNPGYGKAKDNYFRLFALQERKYIAKDKITFDILKDSSLEVLGNLIIFKITLINKNPNVISIDPRQALLVVDEEDQIRPLEGLADYPVKAYQNDLITVENYARLRHFLDTHPYSLIEKQDIQPGISIKGHMAFSIKYPHYKKLKLIFPISVEKKYKLLFKLPFTSP